VPSSSSSSIAGLPNLPERLRVLVLDDQRFDRHKLCRMCSALPIKCEVAQADSLSAFAKQIEEAAFDLVFVDYSLPDGSGIDALEMLHLSPRNNDATSIMITSFDEEPISFEAMMRGCADYITKDELSPSSFERAVTNALQKTLLSAQVQSQTFARVEVERVLNRFANQCVSDIKPMVSRMIRQLRTLREAPGNDQQAIQNHRASVEASCLHLWEFLEELEQQRADVMMKDMIGVQPSEPNSAVLETTPARAGRVGQLNAISGSAPKRPPSPFSRPTQ
jgi:CheY-like chemotaxis protein